MIDLVINSSQQFIGWLSQPWHWSVSGAAIALVLFLMTYLGRSFGVSTIMRNFCNLAGAGKRTPYFNFDIREEYWRFAFIGGAVIGGIIAANYLSSPEPVAISESTISHLRDWNIDYPQGNGFWPTQLMAFSSVKGILLALAGGFLVGFGARYGSGCTSGHAITGLSHLQLPSLITVIGFFIGGLFMTWFLMPLILG